MISNQRTSDSERLSLASDILLAPAQLGTDQLQSLLGGKLAGRADYADVYFQHSRHEAWILEDGLVRDASFNLERGAGVRLVSGDKTGFAYSDDISLDALTQAGSAAAAIGRQGKDQSVRIGAAKTMPARYPALDPLPGWSSEMKVALLQEMDRLARSLDPAVKEVTVSLSGEQDVVLVAATDGTLAADVRPLIRFNISVIAERGGRRERGSAGGGGRVAYDWLRQDGRLETWTRDAVRQALLNLDAEPAPAGTMPVVLGPGWPGVLLHEAVGHGLEGDFNRKGTSMFAKMMGQQVASSLCTVVDDGTLPDRRGSLTVDDEGTPGGYNTLIEDGKLVGHMQDKTNARLMGVAPTGNGRR
ncbi:MAG TPA: metalloprotease TldD, partial [Alcanivorax sp.]|nr:metalloprotease TldD [Alcanivorax sp.]HCO65061.1 metalloprotease TldD [Alcanivorax sp.]